MCVVAYGPVWAMHVVAPGSSGAVTTWTWQETDLPSYNWSGS